MNFDKPLAAGYDDKFSKLAPMKDALHLLTRIILGDLPKDAHILCVGVGTGAELFSLAHAYPQWHFTAVDPSAAMLDICRQRAQDIGIASRCHFHEGFLETLPRTETFHAATSILVSHFMPPKAQHEYFKEIASHLKPNGIFINACLAADTHDPTYENLLELWACSLKHSDIPPENIEKMLSSFGEKVSLLAPVDMQSLLFKSGFAAPTLFLQTLLIHAWYCRKKH